MSSPDITQDLAMITFTWTPSDPCCREQQPEDGVVVEEKEEEEDALVTAMVDTLTRQGAIILNGAHDLLALRECHAQIQGLVDYLEPWMVDPQSFDSMTSVDAKARAQFGIVRVAKIGAGKKNIHFESYGSSPIHQAMAALGEAMGVTRLLRQYCGEDCSLNETGISFTRPGGEGLEWHADGKEGECTMIMALEDIDEQGRLGVVLGSHTALDRETTDDFDAEILEVVRRSQPVYYAYRKEQPILFDARTLHAAEDNTSKRRRCILWWIYNCED